MAKGEKKVERRLEKGLFITGRYDIFYLVDSPAEFFVFAYLYQMYVSTCVKPPKEKRQTHIVCNQKKFAKRIKSNDRTVRRTMKKMIDMGVLLSEKIPHSNQNRYKIDLERIEELFVEIDAKGEKYY